MIILVQIRCLILNSALVTLTFLLFNAFVAITELTS